MVHKVPERIRALAMAVDKKKAQVELQNGTLEFKVIEEGTLVTSIRSSTDIAALKVFRMGI